MPRSRFEPPFVLAVDIGSSSVKGALYDARARLVPDTLVRAPGALHLTPDGGATADAEEVARRVETVVDAVLADAHARRAEIAAVGFDTLAFTTCGVDREGRPLTPLYTYADGRSRDDVRALAERIDLGATYQRTGTPLHTAYLPARLLWLKRTQPRLRPARWLDIASFLYGRWFGRPVPVSYSIASWSGLLDRRGLRWDAELLRLVGVTERSLPQLADWTAAQSGLARRHAKRWPALREVPFFLAIGDGAAANVGSGCVTPGRLALTVGTTGALRVALPRDPPKVPLGLWAYRIGARETLLGGAFNEGGNVYGWATSTFRVPRTRRLDQELKALPPAGHGLTVLPFVEGERSPGWSSQARAAITGISGSTSGLQLVQAALEAVSYRFGLVARMIAPHLAKAYEVVASGGAMSRSPFWVQLMADVLQQPVLLSHEAELTSRGAAILALRGLGRWSTLEDVPLDHVERFEPDPARGPVYRAAMDRQHALYDALLGHAAELGPRMLAAARRRARARSRRPGPAGR
jgi:gluconokinase